MFEKQLSVTRFFATLLAIAAVVAFFLPYVVASGEYAEWLDKRGDVPVFERDGILTAELKELSLFDHFRIFSQEKADIPGWSSFSIICAVIFAFVCLMAVMCFLFAVCKLPIFLFISNALLAFGFYTVTDTHISINNISFGIISENTYVYAIGHTLYWPIIIAIAVLSIWMFIAKHNLKKQRKAAQTN